MRTSTDSLGGQAVLTLAHVVGMVDMIALPLWIGALMAYYHYSPPQAGITITTFLAGVVVSSIFLAQRFNRWPRRLTATCGFALAAVSFGVASLQPVDVISFGVLLLLHGAAGFGVGCALSVTHGSMGRSTNPHRVFGVANSVMGVFGVMFLAGMPGLLRQHGGALLFSVIATSMGLAAAMTALLFPESASRAEKHGVASSTTATRVSGAVWLLIGVVVCMTLNQSMIFSFVERMGAERGFGADRVNGVLVALGLVNLTPGLLAALLQKKWSPVTVGFFGPVGQGLLALVMSASTTFWPYATATSLYVSMVIFTHVFVFGLMARLDRSGRAVAATPATMMIGSCIGPALGGAIVQTAGYPGLGWAASAVSFIAVMAMVQVQRRLSQAPALEPLHA